MSDHTPIPFNDLRAEYREIKEEVDAAIQRVLASGRYILGPCVEELETALAGYCQASHAVAVASGTDALLLSLLALDLEPGEEVITTPFSYVATASAILRAGAIPVFADVDAQTFNLDARRVADAITARTRAIVPVHLFGQPADIDALRRLAARHSLAIVEDAAQAIGARYRDRSVGGLGDAAAFSFYPTKTLGAYGDGGAVVTNRADLAERVDLLRRQGERQSYVADRVGFNSRLDAIQAAILLVKIQHLDAWVRERRARACIYNRLFRGSAIETPAEIDGVYHAYHQYTIRVPERRDELRRNLQNRGISSAVYYPVCLHLQSAFAGLGYTSGDLPVAEALAASVLSLPCFPTMTEQQQHTVAEAILSFYSG